MNDEAIFNYLRNYKLDIDSLFSYWLFIEAVTRNAGKHVRGGSKISLALNTYQKMKWDRAKKKVET